MELNRVLIVDDDPAIRRVVSALLEGPPSPATSSPGDRPARAVDVCW